MNECLGAREKEREKALMIMTSFTDQSRRFILVIEKSSCNKLSLLLPWQARSIKHNEIIA